MTDQFGRKPEVGDFILRAESTTRSSAKLALYRIASLEPTELEEVEGYKDHTIKLNKRKQLGRFVIIELPSDLHLLWNKVKAGMQITYEEGKRIQ